MGLALCPQKASGHPELVRPQLCERAGSRARAQAERQRCSRESIWSPAQETGNQFCFSVTETARAFSTLHQTRVRDVGDVTESSSCPCQLLQEGNCGAGELGPPRGSSSGWDAGSSRYELRAQHHWDC